MPLLLPLPRLVLNPNPTDPWVGLHLLLSITEFVLKMSYNQIEHIPVKNNFQILQNLNENTDESHEDALTGLAEVVTASAGTTLQISRKQIPNCFHKQVHDQKLLNHFVSRSVPKACRCIY